LCAAALVQPQQPGFFLFIN